MPVRFSPEWESEFSFVKGLQEDRIHMNAVEACTPRCIRSYWTHQLLWYEEDCMRKCVSKHMQAGMITSATYTKLDELSRKK